MAKEYTRTTETFQSTLPARGATFLLPIFQHTTIISIHAPREGSDYGFTSNFILDFTFQSTLPARGATLCGFLGFLCGFLFQSTLPARGATRIFVRKGV